MRECYIFNIYFCLCNTYRLLHGWWARTIFIHQLWRITNEWASLLAHSFVILHNSWIKIVQATQPWSNCSSLSNKWLTCQRKCENVLYKNNNGHNKLTRENYKLDWNGTLASLLWYSHLNNLALTDLLKQQFTPPFDVKEELSFRPFIFLFLYLQLRIIAAMSKDRLLAVFAFRVEVVSVIKGTAKIKLNNVCSQIISQQVSKQLRFLHIYFCYFCNFSVIVRLLNKCPPREEDMSVEAGVFLFCQAVLSGFLSFAGDPSVSYMLSHFISWFRLIQCESNSSLRNLCLRKS